MPRFGEIPFIGKFFRKEEGEPTAPLSAEEAPTSQSDSSSSPYRDASEKYLEDAREAELTFETMRQKVVQFVETELKKIKKGSYSNKELTEVTTEINNRLLKPPFVFEMPTKFIPKGKLDHLPLSDTEKIGYKLVYMHHTQYENMGVGLVNFSIGIDWKS